jgi:hypothetical protein
MMIPGHFSIQGVETGAAAFLALHSSHRGVRPGVDRHRDRGHHRADIQCRNGASHLLSVLAEFLSRKQPVPHRPLGSRQIDVHVVQPAHHDVDAGHGA